MTILDAIKERYSVRSYKDIPIPKTVVAEVNQEIDRCNRESGLNIQLITDEERAFGGMMAHYGKFSGVKNYIALVGKKSADLDEKIGYYGERAAIKAQMLGLNTCWVAMTFSKRKCGAVVNRGEKLVCVISVGYGETQGTPHKSKPVSVLCKTDRDIPKWFAEGMEAAVLAPTAVNQQKFMIELKDGKVFAKSTGGFYTRKG